MSDQGPPPPPPPEGFPPPIPPTPSSFPPPPAADQGFGAPTPGFGAAPPGYQQYQQPVVGGLPPGVQLAGFWVRFVALIIDGFVTGLFWIPARFMLANGATRLTTCTVDTSGNVTGFGGEPNARCTVPTGTTIALAVLLGLFALLASAYYWGQLEGSARQSLGKRALGIKVVDIATGQPIGFGRAVGRWLFKIISFLVCLLGFLWAAWDPKKQAWHDKVVHDVVIRT